MINKFREIRNKLTTYWSLGPTNVVSVALHRITKKLGLYQVLTPIGEPIQGPFFLSHSAKNQLNTTDIDYFSYHRFSFPDGPSWFTNPQSGLSAKISHQHWSLLSDSFSPELGDIKMIWEASRFDWMPKWAWQTKALQSEAHLEKMELWLLDWCVKNPVNVGWNWMCGQETSLRSMNVLLSAKVLETAYLEPSNGLLTFYETHLKRIIPTLRYAMAQDNNHGTSEAACLFVLGGYLTKFGDANQSALGRRCQKLGYRWLENRVRKLVMSDGSFSQHSVTYHRLMLDSLSYVELFRRDLNLPAFSPTFYSAATNATNWLESMVDPITGGAPNLGSNDGAYIFNCMEQPYRDFRPSVALALSVFCHEKTSYFSQHAFFSLFKLDYQSFPSRSVNTESKLYSAGGYCRLCSGPLNVLLRLPIFRFRPAQSDVHHLDVWCHGVNIIRDGGSYCYNSDDDELVDFFVGTRSHSTVRFDNRNQMPKLSRFLVGRWLQPDLVQFDSKVNSVESQYTDAWQAMHKRSVHLLPGVITVTDQVAEFEQKAELRWRLMPAAWELTDDGVTASGVTIHTQLPEGASMKLIKEPESLHYQDLKYIPVLLITLTSAATVKTTITISDSHSLNAIS